MPIEQLTDDQKSVIKNRWARGISVQEISETLGYDFNQTLDLVIELEEEFQTWCLMELKKKHDDNQDTHGS